MAVLRGISIQNANFDDLYITKGTDLSNTTDITSWDTNNTLLWANFNDNLIGGNIDDKFKELFAKLRAIRIKRCKVNDNNWVTIYEHNLSNLNSMAFNFRDTWADDADYIYAWCPVLKNGTEAEPVLSAVINTHYDGVFISDADTIYKFYGNVSYGNTEQNYAFGLFEPFRRKYPIYVTNSDASYKTGSITAQLMGSYLTRTLKVIDDTGALVDSNIKAYTFDAKEITQEENELLDFLTNKKPKVIRDWTGKYLLVVITGNPSITYDNKTGNMMKTISFNYTECGSLFDQSDIDNVGLVKRV